LKRFWFINFGEVKDVPFQLFGPKGEFWNRLKGVLDVSKNVSESAKNDLDDSRSGNEI